jgi:hypothetical protein
VRIRIGCEIVLIDRRDVGLLKKYTWRIHSIKSGKYVSAKVYIPGKGHGRSRRIYLHREILKTAAEVDHRNRNPLDNRRSNLRECTSSQNKMNQKLRSDNKSGFKGVSVKAGKYYVARAKHKGSEVYLGCFKTPHAAARKYDEYVRENYGDFASPNEVE